MLPFRSLGRMAFIISLSGLLLLGGFWVEDKIGLKPIPADIPITRSVADPAYAAAIEHASKMIASHRSALSSRHIPPQLLLTAKSSGLKLSDGQI